MSDLIRASMEAGGLEASRQTFHDHANEMREKHGASFWMREALLAVECQKGNYAIIDGVRNLGEIEELKNGRKGVLIAVNTNDAIRHERLDTRSRDVDTQKGRSVESIMKLESDPEGTCGHQVLACMEQADFVIDGDLPLEEFCEAVRALAQRLKEEYLTNA